MLDNPAKNLVGQTVLEVWFVEEMINLDANGSTGGYFCVPYRVKHLQTGQRAFLKVLDVVKAIQSYGNAGVGVAQTLNRIASSHLFETQLIEACRAKRLDRVVIALAYGEIPFSVPPLGFIGFPFLIFELADGDTHKFLAASGAIDLAWWFSTLHQAAVGISQLHGLDIAHQDLKPSNVVFFGEHNAKLTDLGRAARRGSISLNDDRLGDGRYVPPEYHYGYVPTAWNERYLSNDLYMLGSLAFSGITSIPMTTALFTKLPPQLLPQNQSDFQDALPALKRALADVLEAVRSDVPESMRELFIQTISQLCNPNPAERGHPKNHRALHGNRFSVERYVSAFHRLAIMAQTKLTNV